MTQVDPDPGTRKYSPYELPADTFAYQSFVNQHPDMVETDAEMPDPSQVDAMAAIQDRLDLHRSMGMVSLQDPRLVDGGDGGGGGGGPEPPTVTGATPATWANPGGPNGPRTTLTGTGFTGVTAAMMGVDENYTQTITLANITIVSDTELTCDPIAPTLPGSYLAAVFRSADMSDFAYSTTPLVTVEQAAAPFEVDSVSPDMLITNVPINVTINGSGFTGATQVDLIRVSNSAVTPCTNVVAVNDTTITATVSVPAGGTNRYHCKVTNGGETAQLDSAFGASSMTTTACAPNPIVGADTTSLTIDGTLFQQGGVNGASIQTDIEVFCTNVVVVSDTQLTCDFPGGVGPSGNAAIRLQVSGVPVYPGMTPPLIVT